MTVRGRVVPNRTRLLLPRRKRAHQVGGTFRLRIRRFNDAAAAVRFASMTFAVGLTDHAAPGSTERSRGDRTDRGSGSGRIVYRIPELVPM